MNGRFWLDSRGKNMVSANCDVREFIAGLENKEYFEMMYLLDKEATEAERLHILPALRCQTQRIETGRFSFI